MGYGTPAAGHFAVALCLFDMLLGYIRGGFSQNFSFLGGHLRPLFFD